MKNVLFFFLLSALVLNSPHSFSADQQELGLEQICQRQAEQAILLDILGDNLDYNLDSVEDLYIVSNPKIKKIRLVRSEPFGEIYPATFQYVFEADISWDQVVGSKRLYSFTDRYEVKARWNEESEVCNRVEVEMIGID